jgi:hypothetical protein
MPPTDTLENKELLDPLTAELRGNQAATLEPTAQARHLSQHVHRRSRGVAPPVELLAIRIGERL